MEAWIGLAVGVLYALGLYLIMERSTVRLIIGLALLGYAANLLIFVAGELVPGRPPIVDPNHAELVEPVADPVPQALILTAIVIGFGVQAFTLVLLKRTWATLRTEDLDRLRATDSLDEGHP
jgi:multicomponent Na+:H+ antiporter subunit C